MNPSTWKSGGGARNGPQGALDTAAFGLTAAATAPHTANDVPPRRRPSCDTSPCVIRPIVTSEPDPFSTTQIGSYGRVQTMTTSLSSNPTPTPCNSGGPFSHGLAIANNRDSVLDSRHPLTEVQRRESLESDVAVVGPPHVVARPVATIVSSKGRCSCDVHRSFDFSVGSDEISESEP